MRLRIIALLASPFLLAAFGFGMLVGGDANGIIPVGIAFAVSIGFSVYGRIHNK